MTEASYWWDEAERFRERAKATTDPEEMLELFELADTCADLAAEIEARAPSG